MRNYTFSQKKVNTKNKKEKKNATNKCFFQDLAESQCP